MRAATVRQGEEGEEVVWSQTSERAEPGPITVVAQPIERFILDELDAVAPERLPDIRLEAPTPALGRLLAERLAACSFGPEWLADWLVGNVLFQARLVRELTRLPVARVRLETIGDDACCRFHTDNVAYRLLCTYRGPGTEWIEPKILAHRNRIDGCGPEAIRRLERGATALIRGDKAATQERPALLHRSPPVSGTGVVRLLLVIDVGA